MHNLITSHYLVHLKKTLGYEGQISLIAVQYHSYSDKGIHLIRPKELDEVIRAIKEAKERKHAFLFIYY